MLRFERFLRGGGKMEREIFYKYLQDRYKVNTAAREGAKSVPRMIAKELLTTLSAPIAKRKASKLVASGERLRLHLGCGTIYIPNWINIDLARPGRKQDLDWDLRKGLPFPPNSVEAIFSEHTLEHMALPDTFRLLTECHRVLEPDGVFRVSVPDLALQITEYGDWKTGFDSDPMRPLTPGLAVNEMFYFHGHRTMYDYETMRLLLLSAGFNHVERVSFGVSAINPCPDSGRPNSLIVEARR